MPNRTKKQKTGGSTKSSLDQLKATGTVVTADTGDFDEIQQYSPQDSTTNPSLILVASKKKNYSRLIDNAIKYAMENATTFEEQSELAMDKLIVEFGTSILELIPGRVSTEVDARLSFDKEATIAKALKIMSLYEEVGIDKSRVLIKIGATWEGIQAARELETKHGIHCNLTLLFSFVQAVACAEANVTLISPFIGRILDYYKAKTGEEYDSASDPGVIAAKRIYNYYKRHGYKTIVMGASYRNEGEIKELAGIDFVTLSLKLLESLSKSTDKIEKKLDPEMAKDEGEEIVSYIDDEPMFRYDFNEDEAAVVKVAEGIRLFAHDAMSLQEILESRLSE